MLISILFGVFLPLRILCYGKAPNLVEQHVS